ncbi:PAS domain S-box protein [Natronomonas halophila]|uniref:receiver/sensor box histidine kinase n=1 Tax=Natronomonas halophila TaxID=2747817 RepID=UPI0015B3B464|nr:PAS domain S-box protein [Natronomonas halophila]QLD86052.1 PAS domain S-box protein [Natronomonas halophila]
MPSGGRDSWRLLYVGDEAAGRVTEAFDGDGSVTVEAVSNPSAATPPRNADCIVSEHALPGTDGVAFCERIREADPNLPFVLYPADGDEMLASEAVAAGVTDYVPQQPETLDVLVDRVHEALEDSRTERRYRALVETVGDPMYVLDDEGYVEFANAAMAEYLGTDREAIVGTHASAFIVKDEFEGATERIRELLDDDGPDWDVYEMSVMTAGGERRQVEANLAVLRADDGTYRGSVGVIRDITDRKAYERKLTRLHEVTRQVIQAETKHEIADRTTGAARDIVGLAIHAVWLYDADRDALVLETITDEGRELIPDPPNFERGEGLAWEVFESGEPRTVEEVRNEPDRYNPETPIRSEMLLPLGDHGVFIAGATERSAFDDRDVSLAKLLAANVEVALDSVDQHRQLRESQRRLERQNERLDEFAGVVSHDLRNPLSVAKGRLELLVETGDIEAHADHIDDALSRMDALIDDLLKLARQGETVTDREPVALGPHARNCWRTVDTDGADLNVLLDDSVTVLADESRLAQLFENLFRNSVEHGGEDVTITVGSIDGDGFYVADDGPGIPESERESVFNAGYSTSEEGTGFGLSIVRKTADAHGWTVAVTESESDGARFEVTDVTFE